MTHHLGKRTFYNANQERVEYDGSPLTWRVSAYAVVMRDKQLLIIKNKNEKLFDILGGGIEMGEDIEQALAREAMEEAGAHLQIGTLLKAHVDWFHHRNGNFHQTLQLFYKAELIGELQAPTDPAIDWVGFVPLGEIGGQYRLPEVVERVASLCR